MDQKHRLDVSKTRSVRYSRIKANTSVDRALLMAKGFWKVGKLPR
jgi:hypothetical protein